MVKIKLNMEIKLKKINSPLMKPDFFSAEKIEELSFGGQSIENIMSETNFKLNDFEPYLPLKKRN